jgi:undecaprenyl-diphosphatase
MDLPYALQSAYSLARPFLVGASVALGNAAFVVLFSAALVLAVSYAFKEQKRLAYLLIAVLVALAMGSLLKILVAEERPCLLAPGKIECPSDYALPSLHALLAFTLVIASVGNRSFLIYLPYALFVAFSRVYLGVHTLHQVEAGLALAFLACVATEIIWKNLRWELPDGIMLRHGAFRIG